MFSIPNNYGGLSGNSCPIFKFRTKSGVQDDIEKLRPPTLSPKMSIPEIILEVLSKRVRYIESWVTIKRTVFRAAEKDLRGTIVTCRLVCRLKLSFTCRIFAGHTNKRKLNSAQNKIRSYSSSKTAEE